MADTPPTPTNIRRPKALPLDSTDNLLSGHDTPVSSLTPLVLPSARNSLLNFPFEDAGLGDLTPAQMYDMNQDLYNDSIPTRALIDALAPMSELREEYERGTPAFVAQIDWLMAHGFTAVRRARGDGDCFYRSLGFAYVDHLRSLPIETRDTAVAMALSLLDGHPALLDSGGIEKLVYEDYFDLLKELVEKAGRAMSEDELLERFQTPEESNAVVLYLRLLTSAQIRLNRDAYDGFLVHPDTKDPMGVDEFTSNIVQAMGKEADNVEIDALARALRIDLDLAYLGGGRTDGVDFVKFRYAGVPADGDWAGGNNTGGAESGDGKGKGKGKGKEENEDEHRIVLLYRPGHYDILVKG